MLRFYLKMFLMVLVSCAILSTHLLTLAASLQAQPELITEIPRASVEF